MGTFAEDCRAISDKRWRIVQKLAISRARRKGLISKSDAKKLRKMPRGEFLDWLSNGGFDQIIAFIMKLIELFSAFAI